jgi:peptidoglycan/LPS O-acetylase OafA/YrhL
VYDEARCIIGTFTKVRTISLVTREEAGLQVLASAHIGESAGDRNLRTGSSESSYIPTLDGWRAIAVSLVIGAHSYTMLMNNGTEAARSLATLFSHAGYGVDIFFALSGYLICTLLLSEKQRNGTISLFRFYVRRAFRILPPILLFLATIVLLSSTDILPHIEMGEILGTLFFYRNYLMGSWYTGHFWSLAVEEQFYAVIPLFLLMVDRQWAVRSASVLIALCIGIRWFEYAQGWFADSLLQFRTENRFDGLLWGCLLALSMQSPAIRAWLERHLTDWIFFTMIAAVVVLLVVFNSQPARRTLVAAFMPLLIGYTVLHRDSFVGRILELPVLKWIGRLSYSLYIWQMVFLVPDDRPLGVLQAFPLNLICPLVCASLSYYILE